MAVLQGTTKQRAEFNAQLLTLAVATVRLYQGLTGTAIPVGPPVVSGNDGSFSFGDQPLKKYHVRVTYSGNQNPPCEKMIEMDGTVGGGLSLDHEVLLGVLNGVTVRKDW